VSARDPRGDAGTHKLRVRINGIEQGLILQVQDPDRPVLLFLHGGPGMPEFWLTQRYPTRMTQAFTVAWWDQRGAGLSFDPTIPAQTMTVEQFVADTLAVSQWLRDRFGTQKIYMLAHSWGSFIGLQAVARSPELFHAYIGMGQITNQFASEREAYAYLLSRYRENVDRRMVRRLEKAAIGSQPPLPRAYMALRDPAMHRLGVGTTRDMHSVLTGLFLPSLRFPGYTWPEKLNLWRGKRFSSRFGLWDTMLATDLAAQVPELQVPAYFLHGVHDHTVSYSQAKTYAQMLRAPRVGFYSFEDSAHSPAFEEPERTLRVLERDVLTGRTDLADTL
jgi:pimeloyl-ACP methyl ester carboxylesterase